MNSKKWHYEVLYEFNQQHYRDLITRSHLVKGRTPFTLNKDTDMEETKVFYIFEKDYKKYALPEEAFEELPLIVTSCVPFNHRTEVYDIVTSYKSARFREEKKLSFRELVDDLCCFEHGNPKDFTLWKILCLAATISRVTFRASSEPAFGKDSVNKVLGGLLGDTVVISNPTVAKLEYQLTNKVIMLNEMANLTGEEKRGLEHFLLSVGDLSNTYEKRSRASEGTTESYMIGELSVLLAYNDKDCYPEGAKYFDEVFAHQTKSRFMPFKFSGKITEKIRRVTNAEEEAKKHSEYLKDFVHTITWYRKNWGREAAEKKNWEVPNSADFNLSDRWANNFDIFSMFIMLYSKDEVEAKELINSLYNRHVAYQEMVTQNRTLDGSWNAKQQEDENWQPQKKMVVKEERIGK